MFTISSPRVCRLLPSRLLTCPRSSLRTSLATLVSRYATGGTTGGSADVVSYSSLQRNMEHNVDIPVPGGGGRRGRKRRTRLWPKLVRRPGQGSTAFHGAEHQELLGLQGLPPGQSSTTFYGAELQGLPPGQSSTAFGGAEHQTHRGFLPGQGSTVFGGAHHGFLPGSSSTAFGGAQHLHHLPPPLSSDGAAEFQPMRFCMFFGSGMCFKGNECTFAHAWEELHPDSPEWGLHRQPRAVYKYWATLRCGSLWTSL